MLNYNPETEEDYGQDPNYQEEVEEQWRREVDEEQWNREEVGQEFNGGEEFGEELPAQDWGEEGDAEDWENGELEQRYELKAQGYEDTERDSPYREPTPLWEHSYPTLDSPFTNYTYTAPSQWTYQSPPLSPLLQPEMVADHPYPMAPTFQSSTQHTRTPPTHYLNLPRQQYFVPTHQGQTFTQRGPIPAKPAWEKPWRAHHTKGPCHSYFGLRLKNHSSGPKGGERERMDFRKATEAIHQVITFVQSLPHMTNNCRNAECWIRQHETWRAESRYLLGSVNQ